MAKDPNDVPLVTPFGIARYPHIVVADTRFDEEGKFKIGIIFEGKDLATVDAKLKKAFTEAFGAKAKPTHWPLKEKDGVSYLEMKSGYKPKCYDGRKNPLPEGVDLGGGSVVRAAGVIHPYKKGANQGVTIFLNDVQYTKLIEKGSGGALDAVDMDDESGSDAGMGVVGDGDGLDI